ncbi:MAG: hypothetical protein R8M14_08245 [Ghiorsea sp.]
MKLSLFFVGLVAASLLLQTSTYAQDWFNTIGVNGLSGSHTSNSVKDSQAAIGLSIESAYLEDFGFGADLKYDKAAYSAGGTLQQSQVNLNAWKLFTPSHFFAQIVLSSDLYYIKNNDTTSTTGALKALTVSSAFNALSDQFSITPSYSFSSYETGFKVSQYDLAIHVALNDLWDHIEYKPSKMMLSDATIAGQDQYVSHKLEYTHYLKQPAEYLNLNNVSLNAAFADRAFFVDSSSHVIYNLSDISKSSMGLYLTFKPEKNQQWVTGVGYEKFSAASTNLDYTLAYAFLELKVGW